MVYSNSAQIEVQLESTLKKNLQGLFALSQFKEYVYYVVITTLLGVAAARGVFDWRLPVILAANWLTVGFSFMVRGIADAPEDAFSPNSNPPNPIALGLITPKTAQIGAALTALLAALLFVFLGGWALILGLVALLTGFLYHCSSLRLRNVPVLNLILYSMMLAGWQFLCGYVIFTPRLTNRWFWPFIFVIAVTLYSEFFEEAKGLDTDSTALFQQTASVLGRRTTQVIMFALLIIGITAGVFSLILVEIIPLWVLILMFILAAIFILSQGIFVRRTTLNWQTLELLQKPFERAAAIALLLQYIIPWLTLTLNIKIL